MADSAPNVSCAAAVLFSVMTVEKPVLNAVVFVQNAEETVLPATERLTAQTAVSAWNVQRIIWDSVKTVSCAVNVPSFVRDVVKAVKAVLHFVRSAVNNVTIVTVMDSVKTAASV